MSAIFVHQDRSRSFCSARQAQLPDEVNVVTVGWWMRINDMVTTVANQALYVMMLRDDFMLGNSNLTPSVQPADDEGYGAIIDFAFYSNDTNTAIGAFCSDWNSYLEWAGLGDDLNDDTWHYITVETRRDEFFVQLRVDGNVVTPDGEYNYYDPNPVSGWLYTNIQPQVITFGPQVYGTQAFKTPGMNIAHVTVWGDTLSDGEHALLAAGASPLSISRQRLFYMPCESDAVDEVVPRNDPETMSVRSYATSSAGSTSTTHTANMPSGAAAGDVVSLWVWCPGNPASITTPAGWDKVQETAGRLVQFQRIFDGTEASTLALTASGATCWATVAAAVVNGIDAYQYVAPTSTWAAQVERLYMYPTQAAEFLVAATRRTDNGFTFPAGYSASKTDVVTTASSSSTAQGRLTVAHKITPYSAGPNAPIRSVSTTGTVDNNRFMVFGVSQQVPLSGETELMTFDSGVHPTIDDPPQTTLAAVSSVVSYPITYEAVANPAST